MPLPNPNAGPTKQMNGPSGRVRNTSTSNASRGDAFAPPTVPNFGASYESVPGATSSLAGVWANLQEGLALTRRKRLGLRAKWKTDRAGARSEAVGLMSDAINSSIEAGMTGSSASYQQQIGVLGDRRAAIEGLHTQMREGILDTKAQDLSLMGQYENTKLTVDMQARAAQQSAALAQQAIDAAAANTQAQLDYFDQHSGSTQAGRLGPYVINTLPDGSLKVGGVHFPAGTSIPQATRVLMNKGKLPPALGNNNTPSELRYGQV